ncbi:ribulokinase [Limibacter armeniacum]|uniref:ribulokinase n=1 Tax=Limibacter armeniacum TaxID=466084 RepID=UPI002FE66087
MNNTKQYVIGLDYGSDSCRAILVNTADGKVMATHVHPYQRWNKLTYCDALKNQFRQHPLDYLEGLEATVKAVVEELTLAERRFVKAISVDTTGSTPVAVNAQGTPLSMTAGFEENPNAMFLLWKDHTAIREAEEINQLAASWGGEDFTKYEGGIYSSEWFWAKVLHVIREDKEVAAAAYSWMEHCDWIPFVLTGAKDLKTFKRSRCAAGHKAMWHPSWDGLPDKAFLSALDPSLADLRDNLYEHTYTAEQAAGKLCQEWASRLGLTEEVTVTVGTFDAHAGALGGAITSNTLVKVMGTSTCDMLVASEEEIDNNLVQGICGQVDGSIIPGMIGLEAGQSGFGDVLAWFKNLLIWSAKELAPQELQQVSDNIIPALSEAAERIPVTDSSVIALDWINGRRTPDANQLLKGAIHGLNMGIDAPRIFKALVEAICFGSKAIVERFEEEGVPIHTVVGMGGVAKKSTLVMQTLADVLNKPIKVVRSEQAPALGAAMYAAVAAGIYPDVLTAMESMSSGFETTYQPIAAHVSHYASLYEQYKQIGSFTEKITKDNESVQSVEAGML